MHKQRPEIRKIWVKIWGLATLYYSQIKYCNYLGRRKIKDSQDQASSTVAYVAR